MATVVVAVLVARPITYLTRAAGEAAVYLVPAVAVLLVLGLLALRAPQFIIHMTLWYITLFTLDLKLLGIPLKIPLVCLSLGIWFASKPSRDYAFKFPVLLLGLGVPVIWFLIAEINRPPGIAGPLATRAEAVEQASRFIYLLLYFPLSDFMTLRSMKGANRVWMTPIYALCAITALLWVGHVFGGLDYGTSGQLFAFKGVIGDDLQSGQFRLFIANQILLIPAFGVLVGLLVTSSASRSEKVGLVVLGITAYLSQTRGIWLGLAGAVVVAVVLMLFLGRPGRAMLLVVVIGVGLFFTPLGKQATAKFTDFTDESTLTRFEQAPLLWEAFKEYPIVGRGLGATLPSGYSRSEESPSSFELTYLQILFQMGIVGALLILLPQLWASVRAVQAMGLLRDRERGLAIGAVSATSGLALANATNPYLLSSFGMLSVAILLACVERSILQSSAYSLPPEGQSGLRQRPVAQAAHV
jgi:hypothetical protein